VVELRKNQWGTTPIAESDETSTQCITWGSTTAVGENSSTLNLSTNQPRERYAWFSKKGNDQSQSLTIINVLPEPHCPLSIHHVLSSLASSSVSLSSRTASVIRSLYTAYVKRLQARTSILQQQQQQQGSRRQLTSPPVPSPVELDKTTSSLILLQWPHYAKT